MRLCAPEKQSTAKKDEKLGYQLFKGFIKNTQAKPNIPNSDIFYSKSYSACNNEEIEIIWFISI